MRILLLAALPQEYQPFLADSGSWEKRAGPGLPLYHRRWGCLQLVLLETGIGIGSKRGAILSWLRKHPQDAIISFGFAGSLSRRLRVGDLLVGTRFRRHSAIRQSSPTLVVSVEALAAWSQRQGNPLESALIVTTDGAADKRPLHAQLQGACAAADMETYDLARIARQVGLPFVSLRAISDDLSMEIDFDPDRLTNAQGQIRPVLVAKEIVRHPQLLRTFYLCWRCSRIAARALSRILQNLLDLPENELRCLFAGAYPRESLATAAQLPGKSSK